MNSQIQASSKGNVRIGSKNGYIDASGDAAEIVAYAAAAMLLMFGAAAIVRAAK